MSQAVITELEENLQQLLKIIEQHKGERGALIPVLHEAQDLFGYLPLEVQEVISDGLGVPLTEVYGVVTFYSQFTLTKKGEYKIDVCLGTACYVRGSQAILDRVLKELDVGLGETSGDGKFTVNATRCIGACGLAPVLMINGEAYGRLVEEDIPGILEKYKA